MQKHNQITGDYFPILPMFSSFTQRCMCQASVIGDSVFPLYYLAVSLSRRILWALTFPDNKIYPSHDTNVLRCLSKGLGFALWLQHSTNVRTLPDGFNVWHLLSSLMHARITLVFFIMLGKCFWKGIQPISLWTMWPYQPNAPFAFPSSGLYKCLQQWDSDW